MDEKTQQKIVPVDIEREVKKSFMEYAMSVISSRALPDVRDGLKPVHRRILYTMYEEGHLPSKPFNKSAATVGIVLARYHPHGDAAVYDTMVRLAQDFSLRYPLVEGHGNFGSVDGDPPAAQRYTEARLSKLSLEMLSDIEKDTVATMANYDSRRTEPQVLPSKFPNLLVNGSSGIAVGMATNIPPHNLGEVIDATLLLLDRPEAEFEELMTVLKGPDFPTAGIILGTAGIRAAYATGKGHIQVRARAEIEEHGQGRFRIVVTEIPYLVNKARLIESIANLHKEKKIEGITDLRDESDRQGMRIVIELARGANPQVVLNRLYSYTQMQDTFAVNMLALDRNQPKTMTLKEILTHYINHQKDIIVRRTKFDLKKAADKAHILEGLVIAVDNIDEVVRIIRASANEAAAKEALMARFADVELKNLLDVQGEKAENRGLSERQATAIVNMRLGQLTGLERANIVRDYEEVTARERELLEILNSDERISSIIREELTSVKERFSDERRTEICQLDDEIDVEDLIKEEDCVYTLTKAGYIKRLPVSEYRTQRRGGRGMTGMTTREEDIVKTLFIASTHDYVLFFTDSGRIYRNKGYQIPEAGRTAKGMNIINLLQLEPEERITAMIRVREFDEERYLFMATKFGTVKRVRLSELNSTRKAGLRAITLDEGDLLISVIPTGGEDHIILATRQGQAMRFKEKDVRPMGREARGVIGIRLEEGDYVVDAAKIEPGKDILSITEKGYGKRTPEADFTRHSRGGKGMILHNLTDKTGSVAGIMAVDGSEDIMMITDEGIIIRIPARDIRTCGRSSQGVIVMRLDDSVHIISVTKTDNSVEDEAEEAISNPTGEAEEQTGEDEE